MTDKKRDESTKSYQPIQQDPARRIRRIQRLLSDSREAAPRFWTLFPASVNAKRLNRCDKLFAAELDWLCRYAADVWNALHREESNKAAIAMELEQETEVLSDVKSWASEEINELRATIAEQKARIEELENRVASLRFANGTKPSPW